MPSPFPGMNPYLEQEDVWQDFHQSFIPLVRETLSEQVRPAYVVKVEEQLFIHELPPEGRRLLGRADVAVADRILNVSAGQTGSGDPSSRLRERCRRVARHNLSPTHPIG